MREGARASQSETHRGVVIDSRSSIAVVAIYNETLLDLH
jgi:hypothetical protein